MVRAILWTTAAARRKPRALRKKHGGDIEVIVRTGVPDKGVIRQIENRLLRLERQPKNAVGKSSCGTMAAEALKSRPPSSRARRKVRLFSLDGPVAG
jgi:hypothetical protein